MQTYDDKLKRIVNYHRQKIKKAAAMKLFVEWLKIVENDGI